MKRLCAVRALVLDEVLISCAACGRWAVVCSVLVVWGHGCRIWVVVRSWAACSGAGELARLGPAAGMAGLGVSAGSGRGMCSAVRPLERVDPCRRAELGDAGGVDRHVPPGEVDLAVMGPAEHDQVGQLGFPAQLPRHDVVHLAPAWWAVAAGVGAAAVTGDHRAAQPVGDGAGGAADVEGLPGPAEHDRDDAEFYQFVAALLAHDRRT